MFQTSEQARREANRRREYGDGLNALGGQSEWAYSQSMMTVGMRDDDESPYRIINIGYPCYGQAHLVTDWVSVGWEKPKRGWHWRRDCGVWKQFKNITGTKYSNVNGMLVKQGTEVSYV